MNVRRLSRFGVCLSLLVAFVAGAAPARASVITLNFSGSADLPREGGGTVPQTYSGSIAWETIAFAPVGTNIARYTPLDVTLTFNDVSVPSSLGTVVTGRLDVHDSYIDICDSCAPGFDDVFVFSIKFEQGVPTFEPGHFDFLVGLTGILAGPATMFSGVSLPDQSFLSNVTSSFALLCYGPTPGSVGGFCLLPIGQEDLQGSLMVSTPTSPGTPVPEPGSLVLLGCGTVAVAWRRRRLHRGDNT